MLTGILKWIFKNFVPYLLGISVGVGFFFILAHVLPLLPVVSTLNWPLAYTGKPAPASPPAAASSNANQLASTPATMPVASGTPTTLTSLETGPEFVEAEATLGDPISTDAEPRGDLTTKVPTMSTPAATLPPSSGTKERTTPPVAKANQANSPPPTHLRDQAPPEQRKSVGCGTPPTRPGTAMDQYLACQWRENCLSRLNRARQMIEQDKKRCPTNGASAQSCLAYYYALEQQYHPTQCNGWPAPQEPWRW